MALIFMPQISAKYNNFVMLIDQLSRYIDGTYIDEFYDDYIKIYDSIENSIIRNIKNITKDFSKKILAQKEKEQENINHIFEELEKINSKVYINLEMENN